MGLDQTGGELYPHVYKEGGQKLYEFREYYLFILKNHVYRTAGRQHWPNLVENSDESTKGISLNKDLFAKVFNQHKKDFAVYDKKRRRVFILEDREKALNLFGKEERKGKVLMVLPLSAFRKEKGLGKVPRKLR